MGSARLLAVGGVSRGCGVSFRGDASQRNRLKNPSVYMPSFHAFRVTVTVVTPFEVLLEGLTGASVLGACSDTHLLITFTGALVSSVCLSVYLFVGSVKGEPHATVAYVAPRGCSETS